MARPSEKLIKAMINTAKKLRSDQPYQWGHMGACNCGNLAQEITRFSKAEIHEFAMKGRGDWSEQVEAFCPTSDMPMDLLINQLIGTGLTLEDLINLERLRDKEVLSLVDKEQREKMSHNHRLDVALYLEKWAEQLSQNLTKPKHNRNVFNKKTEIVT